MKIPGQNKVAFARPERIEALSEEEFTWYGKFEDQDGYLMIFSIDGEISGHIVLDGETYAILPLAKSKYLLATIDKEVADSQICGTGSYPSAGDFNNVGSSVRPRYHC